MSLLTYLLHWFPRDFLVIREKERKEKNEHVYLMTLLKTKQFLTPFNQVGSN